MNPLISVIMCTYNEKIEYIKQATESILNQTYQNIELIIVVDNPSNNNALVYLKKCAKDDTRVRIHVNEKNIGLPNSLNIGLDMAKGSIVARMDADDVALPSRLEEEYLYLIEHPDVTVVSTNKIIVDSDGKVIGSGGRLPQTSRDINRALKYVNIVLHPGVMFYKRRIMELGGYRNIYAAEDYDLWLRVISDGKSIGLLDKKLMKYRMSGNNITSKNAYKMWCTHKYVLKLFYERKAKGHDSYDKKSLNDFLQNCKCYESNDVEKFNMGSQLFHEARFMASEKKYCKAAKIMALAVIQHREMLPFIFNAIQYKIVTSTIFM